MLKISIENAPTSILLTEAKDDKTNQRMKNEMMKNNEKTMRQ